MITRPLTITQKIPNQSPIIDITDRLPKHKIKQWPKRSAAQIQRIIVHHMASEAPLINQANYHINHHGWPGLAYHLVIVKGQVYQTNDLISRTSHAMGANDIGIGIAVLGDLSKRDMTLEERNALYAAILTVRELFPHAIIQGHNEASKELANHSTSCPCTNMDRIRKEVLKVENEKLNSELDNTPNATMTRIYAAKGRLDDLYKLATTQGQYQAEAQRKMTQIADMMVQSGILKA